MKIPAKLKIYGPVAAFLSAGALIFLGGAMSSASRPENAKPLTEKQRITRDIVPSLNTIQGKATVNKTYVIQKGALLIYTEKNMKDAATYGAIDPNGNCLINNVPEGPVIVVLRPDTESFRKSDSQHGKHQPKRSNSRVGCMGLTVESTSLWGIDADKRELMLEAFCKYWAPDGENALRVNVSTGMNQIDFDFKVP